VTLNLLPRPRSVEPAAPTGRVPRREPEARRDPTLPPQSYGLRIDDAGVVLVAADDAGAFYGRATLDQLARLTGDGALPACRVHDWPDQAVRGVMLDVSRDKVPTLETLRALVDRLASWKVNQLQLYLEHTFAYRDHEDVWRDASPYAAEDIQALDAYCRERFVELVPNQNCLGHMARWLRHERYRDLAVAPGGYEQFGRHRPPGTIEPSKPGSLALVRELLAELLPNFTSQRVHVGLDEPFELPAERVDEYLDWVRRLRALPELAGREMLMWGDMVAGHPERIAALPDDLTICEWGYEDWHPFDEHGAQYTAAGRPFWVCPGTSSWLTILGRVTNMRADITNAVAAARAHGAAGLLNTDWGDMGHLQYLPVSEPGFAYGAAAAWCLEANRDLDLADALSVHGFDDPTGELAHALLELGDAYLRVTPQFPNLSTLVFHLYQPQLRVGQGMTEGLTVDELAGVELTLASAFGRLAVAAPRRADGALVLDELRNAIALVQVLIDDAKARLAGDGSLRAVPQARRSALAAALQPVIERHRELWLARNRPGGLDDSAAWLEHLLRCYEVGEAEKDWGEW